MLDKQLFILVQNYLVAKAPLRGVTTAQYQLRYQPLQQGRNNERTVYLQKIMAKRYGWRSVTQRFVGGTIVDRTETQSVETTLQFSVTQPPALLDNEPTHSDILNMIASTLQSDGAIKFMVANGASILRVTDIRTPQVNNDQDRNEENATFDMVIKHNDTFVDGQPFVDTFTFKAIPVPNLA